MSDGVKQALISFFAERSEPLERVAIRARDISGAPAYDTATTTQFLHGFATVVREALDDRGKDARDLFTASVVQVVGAEGRSVGALGGQLVTFAALLAEELRAGAGPEAGGEAVAWFAAFLGEWTQELLQALEAAAA